MTAGRPPKEDTAAVLEFIRSQQEPVGLVQITEATGFNRSRVSKIINMLKQTGRAFRANPDVPATTRTPALYTHIKPVKQTEGLVPPRRVNILAGHYTPPAWQPVRPGAMDAYSIPSKGI